MVHSFKIRWSNPITWNRIDLYKDDWDGGLYYITRRIHMRDYDTVTPIYIGKSKNKISRRIFQHSLGESKTSFLDQRGDFEVRLGRIVYPTRSPERFHFNRLLLTLESALIKEVKPKCNISQVGKYTRWYKLIIFNEGKRDQIPKIIDNRMQDNGIDYNY